MAKIFTFSSNKNAFCKFTYLLWLFVVEFLLALSMASWWDPDVVPSFSCFCSSEYPFRFMALLCGLDSEPMLWRELIPLWCVGVECVEEYGEGVEDSTPVRSLRYWHQRLPISYKWILLLLCNQSWIYFVVHTIEIVKYFYYLQQELLGLAWDYPSGYLRLRNFCELRENLERFHHNDVPCNSNWM